MRLLIRLLCAAVSLLLAASPALAAPSDLKLVAVFGLNVVGTVDAADKAALEEQLRTEAGQHLAPGGLLVLTGETQLQILDENGLSADDVAKACEQSCPLKVAQELKVRTFVAGSVTRGADGSMVMFVRAFDGITGAMISSASVEGNGGRELRQGLTAAAPKFFGRVLENYGVHVAGTVPAMPGLPGNLRGDGALGMQASADALVAYDAAVQADAKGRSAPAAAAEAWDKLAAVTDRNPYAADARTRAQLWRDYEKNHARDREDLRKVLGLSTFPVAQKTQLARSFRAAYGEEEFEAMLAAVEPKEQARELCEAITGARGTRSTTVELRDEDGGTLPGDFTVSFDGRTWGPLGGTHVVPRCTRLAYLREARTRGEFQLSFAGGEGPIVLVSSRLAPGVEHATDLQTGLQWTRAVTKDSLHLNEARAWCRNLALDGGGWRLPNVAEARTLVGLKGLGRAFAAPAFYTWSWTTSRSDGDSANAYMMGESSSPHRIELREDGAHLSQQVRCVRTAPGFTAPPNSAPEAFDPSGKWLVDFFGGHVMRLGLTLEYAGATQMPYLGLALGVPTNGLDRPRDWPVDLVLRFLVGSSVARIHEPTDYDLGGEAEAVLHLLRFPKRYQSHHDVPVNLDIGAAGRLTTSGWQASVVVANTFRFVRSWDHSKWGIRVYYQHPLAGSGTLTPVFGAGFGISR